VIWNPTRDFLSSFAKSTTDNGSPASHSPSTTLTPSCAAVCQEADLVAVIKALGGISSSKSSQLLSLPPLPPRSARGSTATVLLLVRLGWPLANPTEVFLRQSAAGRSNCDSVWRLPIGSGTVFSSGRTRSFAGKSPVSVYVSLVCFSSCPLLQSLRLSLCMVYWKRERKKVEPAVQFAD